MRNNVRSLLRFKPLHWRKNSILKLPWKVKVHRRCYATLIWTAVKSNNNVDIFLLGNGYSSAVVCKFHKSFKRLLGCRNCNTKIQIKSASTLRRTTRCISDSFQQYCRVASEWFVFNPFHMYFNIKCFMYIQLSWCQ